MKVRQPEGGRKGVKHKGLKFKRKKNRIALCGGVIIARQRIWIKPAANKEFNQSDQRWALQSAFPM